MFVISRVHFFVHDMYKQIPKTSGLDEESFGIEMAGENAVTTVDKVVEVIIEDLSEIKNLNNQESDDIEFIHINSDTIIVPENVDNVSNDNTNETVFCGLRNDDQVSCYANSVIQVLFHCQSLVDKIQNNELGPIIISNTV